MNDKNLLDILAPYKKNPEDARNFLRKLAAPSLDTPGFLADTARAFALPVGLGAATGALSGGIQYFANRPGKDGAPSKQQQMAEQLLASAELIHEKVKAEKREPTYDEAMLLVKAKALKGMADAYAKHPGKGTRAALVEGMRSGFNLGGHMQTVINEYKKHLREHT